MTDRRDSMRPRKGDLLVKLRDREGEITVLIEAAKVKPHHLAAIATHGQALISAILADDSEAATPKSEPTNPSAGSDAPQRITTNG